MTIRLHEEHEGSKSDLLGPDLLYQFGLFLRQPLSRVSVRKVVALVGQSIGRVEAQGSVGPPPCTCARSDVHGMYRMVGSVLLAQPGLDRC